MNEKPPQAVGQYDRKTVWSAAVIGGLTGAALCGLILFTVLPSQMTVTHESRLGFDETIATVMGERVVEDERAILAGIVKD